MPANDIYVRLTQEWGGYAVGDVIRFGYSKGRGRIEAGEGVEVKPQPAVNDPPAPRAKPAAETTMATPAAETADNPPEPKAVERPKADSKPAASTWRKRKDA